MSYPYLVLQHLPTRSASDPFFYYLRPFDPHYPQYTTYPSYRSPQVLFSVGPLPYPPIIQTKIAIMIAGMFKHCSCFPSNGWPRQYTAIDIRLPIPPEHALPNPVRIHRRKPSEEIERMPDEIKRLKTTQ